MCYRDLLTYPGWALESLDETILMSYFTCEVQEQKKTLEPLFLHADRAGKRRSVKVAILAGTKRTGREISCERHLGSTAFSAFLRELHAPSGTFRSG